MTADVDIERLDYEQLQALIAEHGGAIPGLYRLSVDLPADVATFWTRVRTRLIELEVVTDDPTQARWIVHEVGGGIRYVVDQLFARDEDLAVPSNVAKFGAHARI